MKKSTANLRLLAVAVLLFLGGCAPAYNSYSGCRVNCRYCPPCPLPYSHSSGCQCHSCAASEYLNPVPQNVLSSSPTDLEEIVPVESGEKKSDSEESKTEESTSQEK